MDALQSERLVIRNFIRGDGGDLYEYLSRADVLAYEPGEPENLETCCHLAAEHSEADFFLAVCLQDSGKMIGHLFMAQQEPLEFGTWEIGYIFNPIYGGRGYATESARRLVDWLFAEKGAHRVFAQCDPRNAPSWKLLERLGMRREGHFLQKAFFRRDSEGSPIWHDAYEYAVLASEWRK
jgi:[ribosomal protein S5]-alanine N-acetyltransferase